VFTNNEYEPSPKCQHLKNLFFCTGVKRQAPIEIHPRGEIYLIRNFTFVAIGLNGYLDIPN